MEPLTIHAYKINLRKTFFRLLWQGVLFLFVIGVTISVLLRSNIPGWIGTSVFVFILLADITILLYQLGRIISTNGEIKIICTLNENGLKEVDEKDGIRILPFSMIFSYSIGEINIGEEENYFRIRLKKSSEEIYFTTNEIDKIEFFNFTEEFIKAAERFNSTLPPGITRIKGLNKNNFKT